MDDTNPPTQPSTQNNCQLLDDSDDFVQFHDEYWGRLYPAQLSVKAHDLTKDETIVGKQKSCDVCLKADEVSNLVWVVISRKHFSISKIQVVKFGKISTEIRLKDLSMNGTFINGSLVGRGKSRTLADNSVISLGKPQNNVYYFKDVSVINTKHPPPIVQKYDASIRLGTGAFGEVTLMFCKQSCKGFAMKSILKGYHVSQKKLATEMEKLENEVKILKKIQHPNVIQLMDSITYKSEKYLFLELMLGKDLYSRISDSKRLTESQAKLYFFQIVSGVRYLHENGIIHRDLKPENVLLETDDLETVVKITDFGLSKVLHSGTNLRSLCGTKLYAAPEVLECGGSRIYTGQVDVWSMGVILFVCLSGQTPFSNERHGKTMDEQIKSGHFVMSRHSWENVTESAKDIVKEMMTLKAESRITIPNIFKHPWLQDPIMIATVEKLIPKPQSLDKQGVKLPSKGKENVPNPASQEVTTCDNFSSSPKSAALVLMSPPFPPPKRRKTVR